jgi:hypothetical protein
MDLVHGQADFPGTLVGPDERMLFRDPADLFTCCAPGLRD